MTVAQSLFCGFYLPLLSSFAPIFPLSSPLSSTPSPLLILSVALSPLHFCLYSNPPLRHLFSLSALTNRFLQASTSLWGAHCSFQKVIAFHAALSSLPPHPLSLSLSRCFSESLVQESLIFYPYLFSNLPPISQLPLSRSTVRLYDI